MKKFLNQRQFQSYRSLFMHREHKEFQSVFQPWIFPARATRNILYDWYVGECLLGLSEFFFATRCRGCKFDSIIRINFHIASLRVYFLEHATIVWSHSPRVRSSWGIRRALRVCHRGLNKQLLSTGAQGPACAINNPRNLFKLQPSDNGHIPLLLLIIPLRQTLITNYNSQN